MNYIFNTCCLLSIVAIDSQGAQSPSFEYNIVLCNGCGSHGKCDFDSTIAIGDLAKRAGCNCLTGYSGITVKIQIFQAIYQVYKEYNCFLFFQTGDMCDTDTDGCSNNPCPLGRNCTDLSPEEETLFDRGYNCSSCPLGYKDVENKCQGLNIF